MLGRWVIWHRPTNPAYYIEDWLISVLIWSAKIWGTMASQAPIAPTARDIFSKTPDEQHSLRVGTLVASCCVLADWLVSTSLNVNHFAINYGKKYTYLEYQTLGGLDDCPIDPSTQHIILKIVGFMASQAFHGSESSTRFRENAWQTTFVAGFEIGFCRRKIQLFQLDFSKLIFQNSSTDQQGDGLPTPHGSDSSTSFRENAWRTTFVAGCAA